MKLSPGGRVALLVLDGIGLVGVVAFTVLAALEPDDSRYLIGQIASVVVVLAAAVLLRYVGNAVGPPEP
jgi:hypothetical protein